MWRLLAATLVMESTAVASEPTDSVPVIVELFTSEGCSSCPPADAALARLAQSQPVRGATIVPLGFHVDYWNHLGWRDPFSSARFSGRQEDYARAFRGDGTYTPQMIVDGRDGFVGDEGHARDAVAAASKRPKTLLAVTVKPTGSQAADVEVEVALRSVRKQDVTRRRLHLNVAITEDNLTTRVERGENTGRTLQHTAVVRAFMTVDWLSDRPATTHLSLDPSWKARDLKIVAFVQDDETREIVAVGQAPVG